MNRKNADCIVNYCEQTDEDDNRKQEVKKDPEGDIDESKSNKVID